ncbi:mercuric reductase [Pedobacter sp. JCM 36344]|uniref:mercuric reductase n=1 Tax=Pedobacter sp. JCM 36344 TaxID=3374280 RepID=UPI003979E86B
MKHYDAIIIGAGQAGIPLAKKLALAGKKTVIIEKRIVGGTCINDGCTPTKAMIASAQAIHKARTAGDLGVKIGNINVDFKKIKSRKDEIVKSFQVSAQKGIESTKGLDLIMGEATFSGEKQLTIATFNGEKEIVTADWIFINTGAKTAVPDINGLENIDYLTSTTILDLEEVPESLVVIGGNYIGLEFGQMFQRFGSRVTILEKSPSIMGREDDDVSEELTKILEDEGLEILTDINIESIEKKDGKIIVSLKSKGKTKRITATHLLIAVGRTPQTDILGLEIAGVKTDNRGNVIVNEKLETNVKGVYALGDVKGGPAFTHVAYNDYTIVYRNLIEEAKLSTKGRPVPYCMFTDPQLGRVGLSEREAKEKGLDYLVAKISMEQVARGIETGETLGFIKAIVDRKTKEILGACMLCSEGGEIMSVLQIAMQGGITYDMIKYNIFAHPTYSESLNNLFMKVE